MFSKIFKILITLNNKIHKVFRQMGISHRVGSIGLPSPIPTADLSRLGSLGLTTRDRLRAITEATLRNWMVECMPDPWRIFGLER
jgi:hypothetical protein